ncbi:hypothetical protein [Bradyrhizobium sp. USDA 4473]
MAEIEIGVKAANEHWETFIKGATLMLGGNGIGLGGCLTMLKDGVLTIPGLGIFIVAFGIGLLGSIAYYAVLTINKIELQQAIISGERQFTQGMTAASYAFLAIGLGGFVAAVLAAIIRFAPI